MDIFFQIGIMIILATIGGYFLKIIKQPLIPAYIIAGLLIGPVFNIITNSEVIETLSVIGIAFLLFIVGLELNFKKLKYVGKMASIGGIIQILILFILGFIIAQAFGVGNLEAVYVGFIIALSSTMVVVKLLSDKRELNTLHGRIIIGILLMQDIVAIFALSALSSINGVGASLILISIAKATVILAVAYFLSKFIFPLIFKFAAKSQELFFLVSVSICFVFSIVFSYIGFSIAIGAFVAGISLANLPYNMQIIGRIKSLKDFFSTLFFVALGLSLTIDGLNKLIIPLIIFTLIVILVKPIVFMFLCSFFGYTKKTSFLTSISLAQISEFSIILATQGMLLGHLSKDTFTLTVLILIITITLTSYLIKFDNKIYNLMSSSMGLFDWMTKGRHLQYLPKDDLKYDMLLIGCDRIGYNIFRVLEKMKRSFLIVDYNPDIIKKLITKRIPCIYGDIGDYEIVRRIDLFHLKFVVSTIPVLENNLYLIKRIKQVNKKAIIFVTANMIEDAMELYKAGADYVVLPHFLGGEKVSNILEESTADLKKITKNKFDHIEELKHRMSLDHEHPENTPNN